VMETMFLLSLLKAFKVSVELKWRLQSSYQKSGSYALNIMQYLLLMKFNAAMDEPESSMHKTIPTSLHIFIPLQKEWATVFESEELLSLPKLNHGMGCWALPSEEVI